MDITLIISVGILFGCVLSISWFAGSDAPYVPTKNSRIKKILKIAGVKNLPAGRQGAKKFYELGSGDGRVVFEAARLGAKAYGIEQSWLRVLYSRFKSVKNSYFIHGDIFKQNLSTADIVFIFLLPKGIEKLEPKLKQELKKGSIIITQTFHFKSWKPFKKILITDRTEPNTLLGPNKLDGDFWLYRK